MNSDEFHQSVSVFIDLPKEFSPGEINRLLKSNGATLDYDVYSFYRQEEGPIWQSESIVQIRLFHSEKEVDAQGIVDRIELEYPLATIDSSYINEFARLTSLLTKTFDGVATLNGNSVTKDGLISYCDTLVSDLMETWGEEPGSKNLRIMIESIYR
ncbi:hypothetical protein [Halomonas binhaiensis]|uniref:Uncharacterized protein n=1 Tax=Halomonas binhaiensis TaxID=2562282 RepID=A0A5C1NHA8_9GAMM|nr:hypothetical protein [Halomonas binhaiensis]QEM82666.1 hypothetical protein E4T21_14755 [Halomonas binhaiensis]